jgi:hypothetical protein
MTTAASRAVTWASAAGLLAALIGAPVGAQEAAAPIADNSFLIEEAYNQEAGVVQHVLTFEHPHEGGDWTSTFTQEWPAPSIAHQLSFTFERLRDDDGVGNIGVNYRYQALGTDGGPVAFAPRLSLVLATGDQALREATGEPLWELNLPLSVTLRPQLVGHWNLGASHSFEGDGDPALSGWYLGQSLVWLTRPRLNLLVEALWEHGQALPGDGASRRTTGESLTIAPGLRAAFDLPSGLQIVPGLAIPIGIGPSSGERSIFLYLSFEHPFRR